MSNITSLNSSIALKIDTIAPTAVIIDGYAMDDSFASAEIETVLTRMSIDGKLSGGVVARAVPLTITLQPDSESIQIFQNWQSRQRSLGVPYQGDLSVTLPALSKVFSFNRGFLTKAKSVPDGKQVLEPQVFSFEFETLTVSPM